MSEQGTRLFEQALQLPPAEREELAGRLLASLDSASDDELTARHLAECEARIDALDRGAMKTVSVGEAFEIARKKCNQ
jgi:putative addiction module component (TIGR02574 family)